MFGEKTNYTFWNIIKNKNDNNNLPDNEKQIILGKPSNQLDVKGDLMKKIEKLPTYIKICLLQGLLKEMKSIKERFEDNKKLLLKKIKNNCYNFYKSKIGMKEIYDYSTTNNPEIHNNYKLIDNPKDKLSHNYDILHNLLFLIRDNNDIMLNLIKKCPTDLFEQLSDFIVNYFYENTIDSSFNEEELIIIVYLILEDLIIKKMPKTFSEINKNNHSYIDNSILSHIFRSITRKVDVRHFICIILSESLIKFEGINECLSISSKQLEQNMNDEIKKTKQKIKHENNMINNRRGGIIQQKNLLKRNLTINEGKKPKSFISTLQDTLNIGGENAKPTSMPLLNIEEGEKEEEEEGEETEKRQVSIDIEKTINIEGIELNKFFYDNNVTLEYLNQILAQYDKAGNKDCISNFMKDYIKMHINQIKNVKNEEIFSNTVKNNKIKTYIALHNSENSNKLVNSIINNYEKIINFMNELIESLQKNITSLPYILKSINTIIDGLLDKKFSGQKDNNLEYQKIMFSSNYLIGYVILPLVTNPNYSCIVTTDVLSKTTKDNLEIVTKIFKKMLSGKLFDNIDEPEYTIFNKYILLVLPKIFDIIKSITPQKHFILPKKIQNLMNTIKDIDNPKRNINYNYFNDNQENIQQQSICFSWLNLRVLIDIINNYEDLKKNEKYKSLVEQFLNLREFFENKNNENINKKEYEFFLFEKINYNPDFQKNINQILEDNIFALMPNKENSNISIFKKCLVDVLAYVNILHKENFNYFVQKNQENIIQDYDIFLQLLIDKINKDYLKTEFEGDVPSIKKHTSHKNNEKIYYNIYGLEDNNDIDADFQGIIFPQIIESVKYELSHNLDDAKAKRLVFCSSYLQLHINDIPQKYKDNNYCLLLMELMKKGEEIINELNISILNKFYLKFKAGEKLNMIISSNYQQIKKMEKCICIEYLFDKLDLPCKFNVRKNTEGIITHISYEQIDSTIAYIHSIQSFIYIFPDFRKFENAVEDLIDLEEKVDLSTVLNSYFKDLKALIRNEYIVKRFSQEDLETIIFELENYVLFKLYDKLYPKKSTKKDVKFYKKCCRLDFVKPENLIKDKKMINEKLWKSAMDLINDMDNKLTPLDKIKNFGKAFSILQNSITFCSGKKELGIDDTISTLIYVVLKSKPKNIVSNSKYCQLFLNPDLSKKQYGILMSQFEMVKNIIFDMKYTDLIGVTKEEFGKDEEE